MSDIPKTAGDLFGVLRYALDEAETTRNGARLADYAQHIRMLLSELEDARELVDCCDAKMESDDWARLYREACRKISDQHEEIMRLIEHGKAMQAMIDAPQP